MFTKSRFVRLFSKTRIAACRIGAALCLVACLAGVASAASIKVVPSTALAGYGDTFFVDIVVEGVPAGGLGTAQFRLNASVPNTAVNGVSDPSQGKAGVISVVTPLVIGPATSSNSGIGDFFWNARSANGILSIDNEMLQSGSGLYSLSHTNGAVLPTGSGTIARFLVKAGTGLSTDHMAITLSDVALLNGDEVFPLDSNTGADIQLRCKTTAPALLGMSYADALNALTSAHLSVGTVYETDNTSGNLLFNIVNEQSSASGSDLYCGSSIDLAINTPPSGTVTINGGVKSTNSPTVALTLTCTDALSGCAQMKFSNDNATWSTPETYASSKAWPLFPGNGPKTVYVKYIDGVGNISVAYTAAITLDMVPPTTTASPQAGVYRLAQTVILSTNETATIYYTADGSIPTTASSIYNGPITIAQTATIKFFAISAYGSSEAVKSSLYTIDTQPPVLTLSALPDGSYTNNATLNIAGTATDNLAIQSLTVNDTAVPINADGTFSQVVSLVAGTNTVTTVAADTAGNTTTDTRSITLDLSAPVITITAPADNSVTNQVATTITGTVDKTVAVRIKVNGGDPAPAVIDANDSFSLPVSLAYGQNTIEVIATDLAGNSSTAKRTVTFDDVNPVLAITYPAQDVMTKQSSVTLQGTVSDLLIATVLVSDGTNTFTPAVTNGAFQQPLKFSDEKTYAITVTATDAAGNTAAVQRNIIYDKTPPVLTIDPVKTPTNSTQQLITGTMEVNSTITGTCPTAIVGTVSYPTATTWQVVLAGMTEGSNIISVTATDQTGNVSNPVQADVVLDTQAPDTLIVNGPVALTNLNTASFSFISNEPGTSFECKLDQGNYAACVAPAIYTNLADGAHLFQVRATDAAGNTATTPAVYPWAVDTIPPIAIIIGTPTSPTKATTALITVTGDDVIAYKYQLDGGSYSAEMGMSAPIALKGLTGGTHNILTIGKDSAGNWQKEEYASVITWVVDITPPALTLSTLPNGAYTNNATLNISGRATDNISLQGVTINDSALTVNADGTFSEAIQLITGSNTITATATDLATNTTTTVRTVVLDQWVPAITITLPADNSVTNTGDAFVTGTVDRPANISIKVNGSNPVPAIVSSPTFSFPISYGYGSNTIELTATDPNLAINTSTTVRTVMFDNISPALAITSPGQDITTNQTNTLLQGTVSDILIATVLVSDGTNTFTPAVTNGVFQQTLTFSDEKTYAITVTATDAAGNAAAVQRNIIYDKTPPVLTIDPVKTPTNSTQQLITGTMEVNSTVTGTCPTAIVGPVNYPTATTWQAVLAGMTEGSNIISVMATDQTGNVSNPVLADVLLDTHAPVTTASPAGGNYSTAINVTLTPNESAVIYFTIDGTTPTTDSAVYTSPIIIASSTTLQFFAIDAVGNSEKIKSATYSIQSERKQKTALSYTGPAFIAQGASVTLSALLTAARDNTSIPSGKTITFTIGAGSTSQSCTGMTDDVGNASCTITSVSATLGAATVKSIFSGDASYQSSSDSGTLTVFAYPAKGQFIIGDQEAVVNRSVTFWGSQWGKINSLSGGSAPSSFKGYADTTSATLINCGETWSTSPGNSSAPPNTVPSYMAVIVSSSIAKSGSTISGDSMQIVIIKTNAGYGSDPGHRGTGTVIGVLCP